MTTIRGAFRIFAVGVFLPAICLGHFPISASSDNTPYTVAVLYFQDLGPSTELAPLRKALAQMLITDLSRLEGLRVVQRERIEAFVKETAIGEFGLATAETAVLVGRALEADYVLQGSFSATSERVTVGLTLASREGALHLPTSTFSRPVEEFMELEKDMVSTVMKGLGIESVLKAAPQPVEGVASPGLAVMDFENLSASGRLDPLQPALSDLFCAALSQIPAVTLVERDRVKEVVKELNLTATGSVDPQTAAKVGRLLGAQRMLVSSFTEIGGILRFDSHLVDTESGQLVAALSVSGGKDTYAALIPELAREVVAALSVETPTATEETLGVGGPAKSWEAYVYLEEGRSLQVLGQDEKALDSYLQCLYLDPACKDAAGIVLNLAVYFRRYDVALDLAERIIRDYSSEPSMCWLVQDAYVNIALAHQFQGDVGKALAAIERGLASDLPEVVKARLLGMKVHYLEESDKADKDVGLEMYREQLGSTMPYMHYTVGMKEVHSLVEEKGLDEAIAALLRLGEILPEEQYPPQDSAHFLGLADGLIARALENRDFETARRLVGTGSWGCREFWKVFGWADFKRAEICEAEGNLDQAIELHGKVAGLKYPNPSMYGESFFAALLKMGDLYAKKGDLQQATETYERVLRDSGGTDWLYGRTEVAEARKRLEELHVSMPVPEGYRTDSLLTQEMGQAIVILAESGYLPNAFGGFTPLHVNPPEVLAPHQMVIMEWPRGGEAWWITQSWLNFVRRGGGLFLVLPRSGRRSAAGSLKTYLGIDPTPKIARPWYLPPLTAVNKEHPAGDGLEGLSMLLNSPFECDPGLVLAKWQGLPVLAAVERGLGRALVSAFGLTAIGKEYDIQYTPPERWTAQPPAQDFILPAFDWLRQETAEGERGDLLRRFRAASDRWARREYLQAMQLLQGICSDYPGTEWDELASYTIGEILQNSLGSNDEAQQQFERVYAKFPKGELALPARMSAADLARALGEGDPQLLRRYAQVVELGPGTEIGATAQTKIAFIHLLADRMDEATVAFRKAVNDFPDGFAKNNALPALGFCYEQAGRTAEAVRIYESIMDVEQDVGARDAAIYPATSFSQGWTFILAKLPGLTGVYPSGPPRSIGLYNYAQGRLEKLEASNVATH